MGRRINLSSLADEPVLETPTLTVSPASSTPATPDTAAVETGTRAVLLTQVAANPINPRENLGDLNDLESMRSLGQLQACAVVSREAFLAIYPEHEPAIGHAEFVIVAGSRRRAAAEKFGIDTLAIAIHDQLAANRAQFYAASVAENIDRKNLDVLEEARAVQRLAQECGSGSEAGEILGRTKGWVSQRLALLRLSTDMQKLLLRGELPIRDARRLAALPTEDQLATWQDEQRQAELERFTAVNQRQQPSDPENPAVADLNRSGREGSGLRSTRISFAIDAPVDQIAELLHSRLSDDGLRALVEALTGLPR